MKEILTVLDVVAVDAKLVGALGVPIIVILELDQVIPSELVATNLFEDVDAPTAKN